MLRLAGRLRHIMVGAVFITAAPPRAFHVQLGEILTSSGCSRICIAGVISSCMLLPFGVMLVPCFKPRAECFRFTARAWRAVERMRSTSYAYERIGVPRCSLLYALLQAADPGHV